jgi:hypothetical protein
MIRSLLALLALIPVTAFAQPMGPIPATTSSLPLPSTTQTQTRFVAGVPGKSIFVTAMIIVPVGGAVVSWVAGTGTNCGSNTVALNAPMTLATGQTIAWGTGVGALMVAPLGYDLCLSVGTAAISGSVSFAQQ